MGKRKCFCFLIVCVMMVLSAPFVRAVEATVYSETVAATAGSEVLCSIRIRDNPGLMGFKLTFTYDESVLSPISVRKGEVIQSGMLNDSINVSTPGKFEVIWSHSSDVKTNGVLMTLAFKAAETVPDSTKIQIGVSQPDTFNEKWEDVSLSCEPIVVSFTRDTAFTTAAASSASVTQEDVRYAVDSALEAQGFQSIAEVEDQGAFLKIVNDNIQSATGGSDYFSNVGTLTDAYVEAVKEEYVAEVQQSVDGDKILLSIDNALAEVGAHSIDAIPEDKQTDFVRVAETQIAQYLPDATTVSDRVDANTAMDTFRELQKRVSTDVDNSIPEPVEDYVVNHNLVLIICVLGAVILAACVATAIYIKKKNSKSEETV